MRTLKSCQSQQGYTLIELAIVITIVGLLVAPAMYAYSLYIKHQRIEQTEIALLQARSALASFRKIYGRYPCPARMDAVPGDTDYGYEFVDASGDCDGAAGSVEVALVQSDNTALSDRDVLIGTLPFRQMNLPDNLVYDGYLARLTYAVTRLQTDDTTYENNNGGIGIIDENNNSAIDPPNSAHFVILTHNKNNEGGISRAGVQIGICPVATLEGENCDRDDAIFRTGQVRPEFDDLLYYNTVDSIEQWQLSNTNMRNIHLRRASSITMGVDNPSNTVGFTSAEILNYGSASNAVVWTEQDAVNFYSGAFLVSRICDEAGEAGGFCFPSDIIAGQLSASEGMECPNPGEFIVKFANNSVICHSEIFFTCPAGDYIRGIDASGRMICDTTPPPECPDDTLNVCGDSRTVTSFFDSNLGKWYGYAYGGDNYRIDPLDTTTLDGFTTVAQVQAYINGLNNAARTWSDAGAGASPASDAMVRATFECQPDATWDTSPVRLLERIYNNTDLSSATFTPLYNSGSWPAEISGPVYNPSTPMSADPNNNNAYHDCWCREDYRVDTAACSGATATGQRFNIDKAVCPATIANKWKQVYPPSGWDTRECGCTPGPYTETPSCHSVLGIDDSGVDGNVTRNMIANCPGNTFVSDDFSGCTCPNNPSPDYDTDDCPNGFTNGPFVYDGQTYTDTERIEKRVWNCPTGVGGMIDDPSEAGSYQLVDVHTETCVCDTSTPPATRTDPCPAGTIGIGPNPGIHMEAPWDCSTGSYGTYVEVGRNCASCSWHKGSHNYTGSPATMIDLGSASSCSCGDIQPCHETTGNPGVFKVYSSCECRP